MYQFTLPPALFMSSSSSTHTWQDLMLSISWSFASLMSTCACMCSVTSVVSNWHDMPPSLGLHGLHVAHQSPLSAVFSRQEYCSGLPCPPPGKSSQPRDRTRASFIPGRFFTTDSPGKPHSIFYLKSHQGSLTLSFIWNLICIPSPPK